MDLDATKIDDQKPPTLLHGSTESLWLDGAMEKLRQCQTSAQLLPRDLSERYTLHEEIGAGAYGVVYQAFDRKLNRAVAIKTLREEYSGSPQFCNRFAQEARLAGQIEHENVARVYDVNPEPPDAFIVMELVPGESLDKWRRRIAEPNIRLVCEIVKSAVLGLAAAHKNRLVHRDIKSANILVTHDLTQVRLGDFGLAQDSEDVHTGVAGSLGYMSPEHLDPERRVDERGDIYGMGVVLFELLAGVRPFEGTTDGVRQQILVSEAPSVMEKNRAVSKDVATIVEKCLQKNPANRYQSAVALASDLQAWLDGRPIEARPVGKLGRLYRWMLREPVVAGLVSLIACAIVTGGVLSGLAVREIVKQRDRAEASADFTNELMDRFIEFIDLLATDLTDKLRVLPNSEALQEEILANAIKKLTQVSDDLQKAPAFSGRLVDARWKIGYVFQSIGQTERAEFQFKSALEVAKALHEQTPRSVNSKKTLATAHVVLADFQFMQLLQHDKAANGYRAAIELTSEYLSIPELVNAQAVALRSLARLQSAIGNVAEAEESFLKAEGVFAAKPSFAALIPQQDVALTLESFAEFLSLNQRPEEAIPRLQSALKIREREFRQNEMEFSAAEGLLGCLITLGKTEITATRFVPAIEHLNLAVAIAEEQSSKFKNDLRRKRLLAVASDGLGDGCLHWGDTEMAFELYAKALDIHQELLKADPENHEHMKDLMTQHYHIGLGHTMSLDGKSALKSFKTAADFLKRLGNRAPDGWDEFIGTEIAKCQAIPTISADLINESTLMSDGLLIGSRMRQLVEQHDFEQAREFSAAIRKWGAKLVGPHQYNIAAFHAVSASVIWENMQTSGRNDLMAEYEFMRDQAVELLKQMHEAGLFSDETMAFCLHRDSQLGALHTSSEFERILAEVDDPTSTR